GSERAQTRGACGVATRRCRCGGLEETDRARGCARRRVTKMNSIGHRPGTEMVKLAVVGLGKMGLSHFAIINAHPLVKVVAVCDATGYLLDVLGKYTGVSTYADYEKMLDEVELDAVIIATPSKMH